MKIRLILSTVLSLAVIFGVSAQTSGDLLRFSQYNYSFGTARSAAMGGAFTSLGADLSSMSINPAGLGMYRSSEIGITPLVSSATMKSTFEGGTVSDTKTKFSLSNFGAALNLYEGSGSLTSFTFGFGYNKLVDFNTSSTTKGYNQGNSMLDWFAAELQGVPVGDITGNYPAKYKQYPTSMWGALLAYETYLVDPNTDPGIGQDYIPTIASGTTMNKVVRNISKGSVGEYTFSGGFNFGNIVYFGLSLGLQDIYYESSNSYYEEVATSQTQENLLNYTYVKTLIMSGTGVNGKFGVTVRPVEGLRIGAALHTPTYITINDQYIEDMRANYRASISEDNSPANVWDYAIVTPTRLLTGISYTFPYGIISADYERVWYNGIRIKETGDWQYEDDMAASVKANYKPANNFRVGLEITPGNGFFIRGGFAYYADMMRDANVQLVGEEVIKSYNSYSGGLGYRFNNYFSLDVAYVNMQYKYLDHVDWPTQTWGGSGVTSDKLTRNNFMLTTSLRF